MTYIQEKIGDMRRFHRWMLHLLRPRGNPLLTALAIAAFTIMVLSLLGLISWPVMQAVWPNAQEPDPLHGGALIAFAVDTMLVAPLFETAAMALLFVVVTRWLKSGNLPFILACTLLFGVLHKHWLPGASLFFIFSYQYVAFRTALGLAAAFRGVALTHAAHNTAGVVLFIAANRHA